MVPISCSIKASAAVLVAAPSGSNPLEIIRDEELGSGIVTTDLQGEAGFNQAPVNGFEIDADYLIDIGPRAGIHGGEVVFAGPYERIYEEATESLTTKYMSGRMQIPLPANRRKATHFLHLKGARQHNLKDISLTLPRNRFVVITGLSGSGKSSLAFDTLYAEGQRCYVESLSTYARQFLEQMDKPDVDAIDGLSPAIAIQQRSSSAKPWIIIRMPATGMRVLKK